MSNQNYYEILGINKGCSHKDIVSAFRKNARKYHPDVAGNDSKNSEKFKKINEAYQVLSNEESRKAYDKYGINWRNASKFDSSIFENFGDIFGFKSRDPIIEDLLNFNSFFEGKNRIPEVIIELTLEEIFNGTSKIISIKDNDNTRELEVKIPKGVKNNDLIKIKPNELKPVNIRIKEKEHLKFLRKGNDLYREIEMDYLDALLGGKILVGTLNGSIELKIPKCTRSSRVFVIRGKGMPNRHGNYGSLKLKMKIQIPEQISGDQVKLLTSLKNLKKLEIKNEL